MPSRKNRSRNKRLSRKDRKQRKSRKNCWSGGMAQLGDTSMHMPMKDSLSQGGQYLSIHKGQYGGSAPYPTAVTSSVLTGPMIASARTGPLDTAMAQIQGMQDGGRRSRKMSRKMLKKLNKLMRNKRNMRSKRSRKHRGGSHMGLTGSPLAQNSMLLGPGMDKQAALNHEWSMVKDPNAFAPRA